MMKNIFYVIHILFISLFIVSCEKDFRGIGDNLISNNKFNTDQLELDITIEPENLDAVRADNLNISTRNQESIEYWLGIYNSGDYKTIKSAFISQLGLITVNPKNTDLRNAQNETEQSRKIDSVYALDEVILKIPYTSTNIRRREDTEPKFRLDSLLGNPDKSVKLNVYQSNIFLNTLNPVAPSEGNVFLSDKDYKDGMETLLNQEENFTFLPNPNDTMYVVTRNISSADGMKIRQFKDTIKLNNNQAGVPRPFLAFSLNTDKMKELFWDKFNSNDFSNQNNLNNYFRGLLLEIEGEEGAMVPIQLAGTSISASVEFYYTISRYEIKEENTDLTYKDSIKSSYSFPLSGVRNRIYQIPPNQNTAPSGSFIVQGTAGSIAKIKIDNSKLEEFKDRDIIINDASLVFNIDASRDTTNVPLRLIVYKDDKTGGEHIKDSYTESLFFGGNLEFTEAEDSKMPDKYVLRITDYISDIIAGETNDNPPLILKVFNNPTDLSLDTNTRTVNTNVEPYNWNPRGVTLFDNSPDNAEKKAKLVISFTETKESN